MKKVHRSNGSVHIHFLKLNTLMLNYYLYGYVSVFIAINLRYIPIHPYCDGSKSPPKSKISGFVSDANSTIWLRLYHVTLDS